MSEMVERVAEVLRNRQGFLVEDVAKDVILAMREPTAVMLGAAWLSSPHGIGGEIASTAWRAMIDGRCFTSHTQPQGLEFVHDSPRGVS